MKKFYQSLAVVLLLLSVAAFGSCESQPHSYSKSLMILKASGEVTITKDGDRSVIHYAGPTGREAISCLYKLSESYLITVNDNNQWKY